MELYEKLWKRFARSEILQNPISTFLKKKIKCSTSIKDRPALPSLTGAKLLLKSAISVFVSHLLSNIAGRHILLTLWPKAQKTDYEEKTKDFFFFYYKKHTKEQNFKTKTQL